MPPIIALLICTAFVMFLLRMERKQSPSVSSTLWIPTIWMLVIASKPLGTWFRLGGEGGGGSPLDQSFLIALICLSLLILVSRNFDWFRSIKENAWLILLLGYMLCSILWSDDPFIALKHWVRELTAVLMAFLVLSEEDSHRSMESLFMRTIYILIPFSVILIKYFPEYGVEFRNQGGVTWIGVTLQKNGLGRLCLIAVFFLIWTYIRRWQGRDISVAKYQIYADISVFVLTVYLLIGPGDNQFSATAVTALCGGLLAFFGMLWMKKHRIYFGANTLTVIMATIIALGVLLPFKSGLSVSDLVSTLGRDTTMTGRTEIWAALVPLAMRRPIVGSGISGYCAPGDRAMCEAHNGYLEVVLVFGFVGLLFFAIYILSFCRRAQKKLLDDTDWATLQICFALMALIHNVSESSISSFTTHLSAILLFLAVLSRDEPSYKPAVEKVSEGPRYKRLPTSRKKMKPESVAGRGNLC